LSDLVGKCLGRKGRSAALAALAVPSPAVCLLWRWLENLVEGDVCVCCWAQVPKGSVKTMGTVNKSSLMNTESWGYYVCEAKSVADAGKIISNCNTKKLQ
jgi:hypothetical protein